MSDENLAVVTIGGTELKKPSMQVKESESGSLQLKDVGNLA